MYDKEKTLLLLSAYKNGDNNALSEVVDINMGLVKSIARRFSGRGTDIEDLCQLGAIGLIKAIKGFDLSMGNAFSTYAVPYIIGEIQRFLRDDGIIKISRETKKNAHILMQAKELYEKNHDKSPTIQTLCEMTSIPQEDAVYALEAVTPIISLNECVSGSDGKEKHLEEFLGKDNIEEITEQIALKEAIQHLTKTEKTLISLRYYKGLTQSETAKIMSSNQVKISRTEKKIMEKLKKMMLA